MRLCQIYTMNLAYFIRVIKNILIIDLLYELRAKNQESR